MVKAILFDFSRTLLFPKDKSYNGGLNDLHKNLSQNINYKFLDNFELNWGLMKFLQTIKDKKSLYIFTSETIQEDPAVKVDLAKLFKKVYSAKHIGYDKKDPESYKEIAKDLKLVPEEILFIDDSMTNIDAAKQAGLETILYQNNESIITKLSNI